MRDFQQRVVDEQKELDEKLSKLTGFTTTEAFTRLPQAEQHRLHTQRHIMSLYSLVLGQRIDSFTP